jgi:DNA-binding LacI/PurR family transcriptional regulator
VEDGRNVIREWAHMSAKPTAFLVSCNHIAAGMVTEAKTQGIRIPEDMTIIGCDDQEVADILGITTISHPSKNVGMKAFELLYEKINEEKLDVKHIELLPELVNRETT